MTTIPPAPRLRLPVPRPPAGPARAWLGFAALAAAAGAYLFWKGRGNNFFYDEWWWIEVRDSGLHSVLASYNEHLLAVPIALYQLLFRTVGLGHYWFYRLLELLAHLGCVAVLFEFTRRRIGPVALIVVLPVLVLGSGWDYIIWPVNFGFVCSLALSIGALVVLEGSGDRRELAACALLVLGLACSEFALVFVLAIAVERLRQRRLMQQPWLWALPLALYGAWWLAYHSPSDWRHNLIRAPVFAAELAASAAGGLLGLSLALGWPLIVAAVLFASWRIVRQRSASPRLLGLLVAAAAFWLLVALGRAQLHEATASRYVYTGVILLVLTGAELMRGCRPSRAAAAAMALIAVVALVGNIRKLTNAERGLRYASERVSAELGALELARPFAPTALHVDLQYAPVVVAGPYFAATDAFHSSPADTPAQILRAPESARVAADRLLVKVGELLISPDLRIRCSPASAATVPIAPAGLLVRAAGGQRLLVRARRFADRFEGTPVAIVRDGHSLLIRARADRLSLHWQIDLSPASGAAVCRAG